MSSPSPLERFIRWVMRDTRYHKRYPATVQRQDGFGPVDVTPDDEDLRGEGLSAVPIWHGLPDVEVKVKPGARVLLGFMAGDRKRPYVGLWGNSSIEEIRFAGGTKPLAREGDPCTVYWPPSVPFVGTVPAGAFAGTMTITTPGSGMIDSGAKLLKA